MKRIISIVSAIAILLSLVLGTLPVYAADETAQPAKTGFQAMRDSLQLTFSDEFDGTEIDKSKWGYEGSNHHRNNEAQVYADSDEDGNAYLEDGSLVIEARKEDRIGYVQQSYGVFVEKTYNYTSACLRSDFVMNKNYFKYGMIEARIKIPTGSGLWPAFWTCGYDEGSDAIGWPATGEIDILENFGNNTNRNYLVSNTIHYTDRGVLGGAHLSGPSSSYKSLLGTKLSDDYHVYGVYYNENELVFYFDDCIINVINISSDKYESFKTTKQFILLNLAMGGACGGEIPESFESARMYVDYVRVYQSPDNDYSHIKFIQAEDTQYSKRGTDRIAKVDSIVTPASKLVPLKNKVGHTVEFITDTLPEGTYDVYALTYGEANKDGYKNLGEYSFAINGKDTGNTALLNEKATYNQHYCGTAQVYGEHNLCINMTQTAAGSNTAKYGGFVDYFILVGNSKNDANVTVTKDSSLSIFYGDLNYDSNVSLLDIIAMRKHLAKWGVSIDEAAADCNADGKISLLDLILLRKYLAKWNVTLG